MKQQHQCECEKMKLEALLNRKEGISVNYAFTKQSDKFIALAFKYIHLTSNNWKNDKDTSCLRINLFV